MPDETIETQHVHTYTTPGTYYPMATCGGYTATAGPIEVEGDQLATPENLTVSDIGDTSATVSWDAVEDAEQYLVTVQPGDAEPQTVTDTTATLEELLPETEYTVSVVAQAEGIGDSEPATETFETGTPGVEPLPTPTGLTAEADGPNAINASWDVVDDADEYLVEYRESGDEDWLSIPVVTEPEATIEDLEPATEYDVRVTARGDGWEDSDPTAPVSATTEADEPDQLDTPTGLAVDSTTEDSISVSWESVEDAETYLVEYRETGEEEWESLAPVEDTEATIPDLEDETEYEIRVTAQADGFTDSEPSDPVSVETDEDEEPEQLTTPENLASPAQTDTAIDVEWDAVDDAEEYEVRYQETDNGEDWEDIEPVTATAATIDDLTADTSYDIQVRAVADGFTPSEWSDTLTQSTEEAD